jgi:hypothetical protein
MNGRFVRARLLAPVSISLRTAGLLQPCRLVCWPASRIAVILPMLSYACSPTVRIGTP